MTKKILVLGCSHVSGHGFEDAKNGKIISEHVWASKITRDFGYEVVNLSSPGHSPAYCVEKIQTFPNKETLSALMIMWPHGERSLQRYTEINGQDTDIPYHHNPINKPRWDMTITNYFKHCHNWRMNKVNLLAYVGYAKSLTAELGIPLWMATSTDEDQLFLVDSNVKLNAPYDWCTFCQKNDYPKLPDGHWGHDAHENFYISLVKPWIKKHVVNSNK